MGNTLEKPEHLSPSRQVRSHSLPVSVTLNQPLIRTLINQSSNNENDHSLTNDRSIVTTTTTIPPVLSEMGSTVYHRQTRRSVSCYKFTPSSIIPSTTQTPIQSITIKHLPPPQVISQLNPIYRQQPLPHLVHHLNQQTVKPPVIVHRLQSKQAVHSEQNPPSVMQSLQHFHIKSFASASSSSNCATQVDQSLLDERQRWSDKRCVTNEEKDSGMIRQILPDEAIGDQLLLNSVTTPSVSGSEIGVRFHSPIVARMEEVDSCKPKQNSANSFKFSSSACSSSHVSVREKVDYLENIMSRQLTHSQKKLSLLDNFITEAQDEEGSSARSSNVNNFTRSSIIAFDKLPSQRTSTDDRILNLKDSSLMQQMIDLNVKRGDKYQQDIPPPSINAFKISSFVAITGKSRNPDNQDQQHSSALQQTNASISEEQPQLQQQLLFSVEKTRKTSADRYQETTPQIQSTTTNRKLRMECDFLSPAAISNQVTSFTQLAAENKNKQEGIYKQSNLQQDLQNSKEQNNNDETILAPTTASATSNVKRFILKIDSVKKEITSNSHAAIATTTTTATTPFKAVAATPLKDRSNEICVEENRSAQKYRGGVYYAGSHSQTVYSQGENEEEEVELDDAHIDSTVSDKQTDKTRKSKIKIFHGKLEHIKINETRSSSDLILYKLDEELNALIPVLIDNEYTPTKQQIKVIETPLSAADTDFSHGGDAPSDALSYQSRKKSQMQCVCRSSSSASSNKKVFIDTEMTDKATNKNGYHQNSTNSGYSRPSGQKSVDRGDKSQQQLSKNNAYHSVLKKYSNKMLNQISQTILVPPFGVASSINSAGGSYSAKKMASLNSSACKKPSSSFLRR